MTMHISTTGPVGDSRNTGNASRSQTKPGGTGSLFSMPHSAEFTAIQQSLNAIGVRMAKAAGASSPAGAAPPSSTSSTGSNPNSSFDFPHLTTLQKVGPYEPLTIKSFYGEPPAGLDRSGLSGIIDKSGHNLSNKEIADFFDGNPTTSDIAHMQLHLGLNDYQAARAQAIWRGVKYVEPIWVPEGASTIGGTPGGDITGGGTPTPPSGAWGNNPSNSLPDLNYRETVAMASSNPVKHSAA